MREKINSYLKIIDEVIEKGEFKDNWQSLKEYPIPKWYVQAKFGIFIHWGAYSVPAFGSEWYPRNMYIEGTNEFEHHVKTYGQHKDFGYKDFIPLFKAEKFDPAKWMDIFEKAGAKFVMPVAEHHDGFQMYHSELSDWCATKMGPEKDILGLLGQEAEKRGIVLCASSHRAENYWFFNGSGKFNSGINGQGLIEPYGYRSEEIGEDTHRVDSAPASKEHLEEWLVRTCEIVDKYMPKVMWFDWWIQNISFKPYLKKFAAYYYNRAKEQGVEVAINYKYEAFAYSTAVFDVERGQLSEIRPRFWQTDTAIAINSWGYTENNQFKNPWDIVCDIVDIVSKNGAMLLNIGPKADGTFTDEDTNILLEIGKWLKVNGESIYGTTYWQHFGEGPTKVKEGAFTDSVRKEFTSADIRFTYSAPYIYANVLLWPKDGYVEIKSLGFDTNNALVLGAEILGYNNEIKYEQSNESLKMWVKGEIDTLYPVCLKIKID